MPLTQQHQNERQLSEEQIQEKIAAIREGRMTFEDVLALPSLHRAEVLDTLYDLSARVRVKADQPAPIRFQVFEPTRGRLETFEIPGTGLEGVDDAARKKAGVKTSAALPLRAAVHVATNRDYPLFGGPGLTEGERVDGIQTIVPVPARPDLLSFELLLD